MTKWRTFIDPSVGDGQNTINGIIADGPTFGVGISDDLSVTGLSTFSDVARFSSTVRLDGQLRDGDNNFGTSGQVLSSDGTDTRWVSSGSLAAGAASQVAINDDSNTNASRFLTFVDSSSGNNSIKTDPQLTYNPSTNVISTAGVELNDDKEIVFGNSSDLKIFHDPSTGGGSRIEHSGHDDLRLRIGGNQMVFEKTNGHNFIVMTHSTGEVELHHATSENNVKLTTTSSGVHITGTATANTFSGSLTGNVTGNISGNAGTSTKLATSRTIGGVSFDGSANINLPGVNQAGNQNTSGNAGSATVLETTRNFSISGEITANAQSFNGSGNVTLSATVDDNVIDEANLKISNSPTNGRFLQCNTGVSGGLTWAEVTVPSANTLSGTTLASGITASSITSLGTLTGLTVNGNVSVTGTVDGRDLSSDGSKLDGIDSGAKDDQTKAEIDALNINADQLDGQHGSYYQNAGNLNAGTVPDARLSNSSLFVTGMIMMYTGSTAPSGWAICNGQNGTPDLRDRFIVGAGSAYSVDDTGGANSVTLTESQIPSHNHSFSGSSSHSHTINNHTHSFSGSNTHSHNYELINMDQGSAGGNSSRGRNTSSTSTSSTSITISGTTGNPSDRGTNSQTVSISGNTGNKGGGGSHENRPPYYALMFIMKL